MSIDYRTETLSNATYNERRLHLRQKELYRQGDLLFVSVSGLPFDVKPASTILAVGETTGHKHQATGQLSVFRDSSGRTFLSGSGQIVHEEHNPLSLPNGTWELRRQREYVPGNRTASRIQD